MDLDDVTDFLSDNAFIIGIVGAITVGILIFGGFINFGSDVFGENVTITIDDENGISSIEGDGKYTKGKEVTVKATVFCGWFFEGWYDNDGNKLSSDLVYTFTANDSCTLHAKTTRGYGIRVYATDGIDYVSGWGSYTTDEKAVITAKTRSGYYFAGWYDPSGKMIYNYATVSITDHKDHNLIAKTTATSRYSGDNATTFSSKSDFDSSSSFMVLLDQKSGECAASHVGSDSWSANLAPGIYELRVLGYNTNGKYSKSAESVLVEGKSINEYRWKYGSNEYTLKWELDTSTYKKYSKDTSRWPGSNSDYLKFVNYNSTEIKDLASKLSELSTSMTSLQKANFILKFVQLCTTYQLDSDYNGQTEYWKYPTETIFEGRGDCEDTSILYCALMKASGYDTALLLYDDHAAASVALDYCPGGTYYDKDGKHYYYCETTSDTMVVGEIWDRYDKGRVIVVP